MSEALPIDWAIQPLGGMPDAEIARQLSVSRERVRQVRARAGIPPYVEPEPEWVAELGTRRDSEIAADYGVSRTAVESRRRRLGVKRCPSRWDREPLLGKVPDGVLAEKHGVHHVSVAVARWQRGIPKFGEMFVDWDAEPRLGKVYDEVLAAEYEVATSTVGCARRRRGIPTLPRPRTSKWDHEPLLGKVVDRELAKKHGVNVGAVGEARRRRGIRAYRSRVKT